MPLFLPAFFHVEQNDFFQNTPDTQLGCFCRARWGHLDCQSELRDKHDARIIGARPGLIHVISSLLGWFIGVVGQLGIIKVQS